MTWLQSFWVSVVACLGRSFFCFDNHIVQAENEFSAGTGKSDYMQDVINTFRENGIVVRAYSEPRLTATWS